MPTLSRNVSEEPDEGPFPDVYTANDAAWQATKQLIDVYPRHELSYKRIGPDGQMRFLGAAREKFISCRVWKQEEGAKDSAVEGLTKDEHKRVSEMVWSDIT